MLRRKIYKTNIVEKMYFQDFKLYRVLLISCCSQEDKLSSYKIKSVNYSSFIAFELERLF